MTVKLVGRDDAVPAGYGGKDAVVVDKYTAEGTGLMTEFRVKLGSIASNIKFAVYSDVAGVPTTLLASGSGACAANSITALACTPFTITKGLVYWLGFNQETGTTTGVGYTAAGGGVRHWKTGVTYSTWTFPATWNDSGYTADTHSHFLAGWGGAEGQVIVTQAIPSAASLGSLVVAHTSIQTLIAQAIASLEAIGYPVVGKWYRLFPTGAGDLETTDAYVLSQPYWSKVDEHPYDDATTQISVTVAGGGSPRQNTFITQDFPDTNIAEIISVHVETRILRTTSALCYARPIIRLGGINVYGSQQEPTINVWTTFLSSALNKPTGGDWHPLDIADIQCGIELYIANSSSWTIKATGVNLNVLVVEGRTLRPSGVVSAELVSLPVVTQQLFIMPNGVVSAFSAGNLSIIQQLFLVMMGISSAESIGVATVANRMFIDPDGISSLESISAPMLSYIIQTLGLASEEAIGALQLNMSMMISAILSAESIGNASIAIQQYLLVSGILSLESVGDIHLMIEQFVQPAGVLSVESVGVHIVYLGGGLAIREDAAIRNDTALRLKFAVRNQVRVR